MKQKTKVSQHCHHWALVWVLALGVVVMVTAVPKVLLAIEWSEPIVLWESVAGIMDAKVDRNDNIHYLCYRDAIHEGIRYGQGLYLRSNMQGELLLEPYDIYLESFFEDSGAGYARPLALCLDNEENVNLLWHTLTGLYVTKLNPDGEILRTYIKAEGLFYDAAPFSRSAIAVNSSGEIIVVSVARMGWDENNYPIANIVYSRFTQDGEMIDSVVVLDDDNLYLRRLPKTNIDIHVSEGDTMHFYWHYPSYSYYSKIIPNSEVIIDKSTFPSVSEHLPYVINYENDRDEKGNLTTFAYVRDEKLQHYLVQYDNELNFNFVVFLDETQSHNGANFAKDIGGDFHLTQNLRDMHDHPYLGRIFGEYFVYSHITKNGNWVERKTIYKQISEYNYSIFADARVLTFSDTSVAIMYLDIHDNHYPKLITKFNTIDVSSKDYEVPINFNISATFPNPFNSSVSIHYQVSNPGLYKIHIYNITGEVIWSKSIVHSSASTYSIQWDGLTSKGYQAPSGSYILELEDVNSRKQTQIQLIK